MSFLCGIVRFDGGPVDPAAASRMIGPLVGETVRQVADRSSLLLVVDADSIEDGGSWLGAEARLDDRSALAASIGLSPAAAAALGDAGLLARAAARCERDWPAGVRGAFAAARWDGRRRRLTLARDLAGERALYWTRSGPCVLFASEPARLVASGLVPDGLDRVRLLELLLGAAGDAGRSAFEAVSRVPEGCTVHLTAAGTERVRHARWEDLGTEGLEDRAFEELASRLAASVGRRLGQRGRVGVLLSGGLDSSAVAAAVAEALPAARRPVLAFTWASAAGDGIDETERSGLLVAAAGLDERRVAADDLWPFSRFPAPVDPNDPETSGYPDLLWETLEIARREGAAVLFNGIGGDPVCGWTMPTLARVATRGLGEVLRGGLRAGGRRLASEMRSGLPRRLPSWLSVGGRRLARREGLDRHAFGPTALRSPRAFRLRALSHPVNARSLERFDRLSRRTGVRVEAPWHDIDLAAWALSLGDAALDLAPPGKSLARRAFAGRIPKPILAADKHGRPSRLAAEGMLARESDRVRSWLAAPAFTALDLVDPRAALELLDASCRQGTPAPRLWEIVALAAWVEGREMIRSDATLLGKTA